MKVAFPVGEWGRAHKCALDEVLVIKDFYCQLLGETRYYGGLTNIAEDRYCVILSYRTFVESAQRQTMQKRKACCGKPKRDLQTARMDLPKIMLLL